jgi:hypothetical protein
MRQLRIILAIATGVVLACLLWYVGVVVLMLATVGIPLGSEPRPLTATQFFLLLAFAAGAAAIGGRVAARIAPQARRISIPVICVTLGGIMLWGFSGRNAWPAWWGPATATAMMLGTWVGGILGLRVRPDGRQP